MSGAPQYTRLPGRAWSPLGGATLWRAADHALLVSMRGYTEVYRRFYFADIQALTLRSTHGLRNGAWLWGTPALLAAVAALAGLGPGRTFWTVVAAIFALPLGIHLARGSCCRCYVTTPLETTELAPLRRVRSARRSLAVLREEIEAKQGRLTAAAALPAAAAPLPAPAPAASFLPRPAGPPAMPSAHPVRWHRTLVALLAADTVVTAAQAMQDAFGWLDAAGMALAIAEMIVALAAILSQRRPPFLPRSLRRFPWAAFIAINALIVTAWSAMMVTTMRDAFRGIQPSPFVTQRLPALQTAAIFVYLGLAVFGLLALRGAPGVPPASRAPERP